MPKRPLVYLLDADGLPYPVLDVLEWARGFDELQRTGARQVALDELPTCTVSTVFLATDHAADGPPILYETATFEPMEIRARYSTREEALAGHARVIRSVQAWEDALLAIRLRADAERSR